MSHPGNDHINDLISDQVNTMSLDAKLKLAETYLRETARESVSPEMEDRINCYIASNGESNEDRIELLDEWVGEILSTSHWVPMELLTDE